VTTVTAKPKGARLADLFKDGVSDKASAGTSKTPKAATIDGKAVAGLSDAIKRQVQPCADRQLFPGPGAENIHTKLNLRLNIDGSFAAPPTMVVQTGVDDDNRRYAQRAKEEGAQVLVEGKELTEGGPRNVFAAGPGFEWEYQYDHGIAASIALNATTPLPGPLPSPVPGPSGHDGLSLEKAMSSISNVISVSRLLNFSPGWLSARCEMRSRRFITAISPLSVNSVLLGSRDSLTAFPPSALPDINGTIRSSDSLASFACLAFGACWAYSEPDRLDVG